MKRKLFIVTAFIVGYVLSLSLVFYAYILWIDYEANKNYVTPMITTGTPMPTITPSTEKKVKMHATIPYWEQDKAIEVIKNNTSKFDYLSLFWYTLDENGQIVKYTDAFENDAIITYAKENDIKVMALITNLPDFDDSEWDSDSVRNVINNQQNRKDHIEDISALLDTKGFDGVNIDYEELDDDLRTEFSLFIQELSTELHKKNKLVSVAIHPKTTEYLPSEDNGSRAQDLIEIGRYVDHMYFMTYGEHWDTSAAGPVASIPWSTKIIEYAKSLNIPTQKIFLGTPLYAVRWQKGTRKGEGLLYEDVKVLEQQFAVMPTWNDEWKSPSLEYTENGRNYVVWFENARSVKEKLKLAEQSELGGITFWHIGGEDPEIWKII